MSEVSLSPTVRAPNAPPAASPPIAASRGIFSDNQWRPAHSDKIVEVVAPAEGRVFAKIADADSADVNVAVAAARKAFDAGAWGRTSALERGRILSRYARLIEDHNLELAAVEARDTGKPMTLAKSDIVATARYFEFYGGAADKLQGETIPYLKDFLVATVREPKGVTAHIIPWNYPAQMFGRTVGAALAVGNAVVVKPAEDACLSILRLAELAAEAGLPPGALNIVTGRGDTAGAALTAHRDIDFIAFTGSPEVGVLIQIAAARNHIGCTLELGGKSPHVVFADADLDKAVPAIVSGIIQNAGQTCSAGSRVLVQRQLYDVAVAKLAERFKRMTAGTPEMDLDLGPVINARQKARIEGFAERAAADGVPLLAQGRIADGVSSAGFFVAPSLFGPVPRGNALAQLEVFGPTLAVLPFEDEDDAVQLANGTEFGLMAAVWTENGSRAMRAAKSIRAGQVYINGFGAGGGIELPFGGMKKSGHGREKGFEALYEYSALKTIILNHK
jgi:aldehyde dehydrogenase (NAD+)